MKHISLFSGIGGDTLAAEWAGFETILFVENDKFCQKVLNKHWPDVPIIGDIKDVTEEKVMDLSNLSGCIYGQSEEQPTEAELQALSQPEPRGSHGISGRSTDRSPITLITGGFPCQPVSVAGKQRGKEDDRWLWPEMLRVIKEVRPKWIVAENVAGLIRMGIDDCISDLENIGYTTESYIIPACAINAPHRRDRVFIVAHLKKQGLEGAKPERDSCTAGLSSELCQDVGYTTEQSRQQKRRGYGLQKEWASSQSSPRSQDVADTKGESSNGRNYNRGGRPGQVSKPRNSYEETESRSSWRTVESRLGRMVDGFSYWAHEPDIPRVTRNKGGRVPRLKALGNAIVPQQIYPILKAIADLEFNKD